jgi:hypothetical protein
LHSVGERERLRIIDGKKGALTHVSTIAGVAPDGLDVDQAGA